MDREDKFMIGMGFAFLVCLFFTLAIAVKLVEQAGDSRLVQAIDARIERFIEESPTPTEEPE